MRDVLRTPILEPYRQRKRQPSDTSATESHAHAVRPHCERIEVEDAQCEPSAFRPQMTSLPSHILKRFENRFSKSPQSANHSWSAAPTSSPSVSVSLSPLQYLPGNPCCRSHRHPDREVWTTRDCFQNCSRRQPKKLPHGTRIYCPEFKWH